MTTQIRRFIFSGLMLALITVFTAFVKIPSPIGYMHLGDGVIFATAALFGPWAGIIAGLGSALADLLAGYPMYILPTFLIKGAMGLIAGFYLVRSPKSKLPMQLAVFALCEILMVAGYYVCEAFFLSYGHAGALSAVPFNLVQAGFGIVLGGILVPLMRKQIKL